MTERKKKQLKYSADYWLTECELPINENYEVEYTEEQLNKELQQLKEEGYNNEEIEFFKACVESFEEKREIELSDTVEFETPSGGKDWYEKNSRIKEKNGDMRLKVKENEILSAVGHQSTADILTTLLETEVPMNRIQFAQEKGQKALVFKLNGRPEEGKILTAEEIEAIGYKFQLLTKISD